MPLLDWPVIGTAHSTEDITIEYVIYTQLYDSVSEEGIPLPKGTLWARPKEEFFESIEKDGTLITRFTWIE